MIIDELIKRSKIDFLDEKISPTPTARQYLLVGRFFWRETDNKTVERYGKRVCHVLGNDIDNEFFRLIDITDNDISDETLEALNTILAVDSKVGGMINPVNSSVNLFDLAKTCLDKAEGPEAIIEYSDMLARVGDYPESHKLLICNKDIYPLSANPNYYIALAGSYRRSGYPEKARTIYDEVCEQSGVGTESWVRCQINIALIDSELAEDIDCAIIKLEQTAEYAPDSLKFTCHYHIGLLRKRKLRRKRIDRDPQIDLTVCAAFIEALRWVTKDKSKNKDLAIGKVFRAFSKSLVGVYKKIMDFNFAQNVPLQSDIQSDIQSIIILSFFEVCKPDFEKVQQSDLFAVKNTDILSILQKIIEYSFETALDKLCRYPMITQLIYDERTAFEDLKRYGEPLEQGGSLELSNLFYKTMSQNNMSMIDNILHDNKNQRISFLLERYRQNNPDTTRQPPTLYILQHWNSFTPIIPTDETSKGGGYYIDTGSKGIVFDPGFDFIKNYMGEKSVSDISRKELLFSDIDMVFITHAHNDHTADIESLITLLNKYNEVIKGDEYSSELSNTVYSLELDHAEGLSADEFAYVIAARWGQHNNKRHKHLDIYLSTSTFKKFATFFDLHKSKDYEVHLINSETSAIWIEGSTSEGIIPIKAKHDDMMSDRDSLGFVFYTENCFLAYTGDTGFNEDIKKLYEDLHLAETHKTDGSGKYQKLSMNKERKCVLLAHIGGFKEYEKFGYLRMSSYDSYYKNHLGRLGLIDLIYTLKPDLCLVSEFGEEFRAPLKFGEKNTDIKIRELDKSPRIILCQLLQESLSGAVNTVILPADISLHVRIESSMSVEYAHKEPNDKWIQPQEKDILKMIEEDKDGYLGYID